MRNLSAADLALIEQIKELKSLHPFFGYRRIWAHLKFRDGLNLNKSLSKIFFNFIFRPIFAYFLVKLFEIYPDIPHNFTKKALKICQNLKLKKILDRL